MRQRGVLLADHGFIPDPGRIEVTDSTVVFYHYTRDERAERVLEAGGGLWARLPVVLAPPGLEGCYLVEGLLEPLPLWMTGSPYFGDLGFEMLREFVGDLLLRVEVPRDFAGCMSRTTRTLWRASTSHGGAAQPSTWDMTPPPVGRWLGAKRTPTYPPPNTVADTSRPR